MGKLFLDLKRFRKLKEDSTHATFQHKDGHTVTVSKKGLTPAMRAQMAALPLSKEKEAPKPEKKPVAMAKGGEVKRPEDDVPDVDPKKAAEFAKGANASGFTPHLWVDNIKKGLGMAEGGAVKKPGDRAAWNEDNMAAMAPPAPEAPAPDLGPTAWSQAVSSLNDESVNPPMSTPAPSSAPPGEHPFFTDGTFDFEKYRAAQQPAEAPMPDVPEVTAPAPAPSAAAAAPDATLAPQVASSTQAPAATPDAASTLTGGLAMQKAGIAQEAKALGAQGAAEAKVLEANAELQRKALLDFQDQTKALNAERQAFLHDYQNKHIDPNHYLKSMGTGQRIATAIGLILGGMGAGPGKESGPDRFLKQQIENDIEAQKASLGKSQNLLSANLQQFGNLKEATAMTRIMQNDIVADQLKIAAAKTQDPLAKARALAAIGKIETENAEKLQKLALSKAVTGMMGAAQQDPSKAPAVIDALQQFDPKQAEDLRGRLVPGMGFANTPKDADHMKEVSGAANNTITSINALLDLAKKPGASISVEDRQKAETISTLLVGALNKQVTGGGPMSEQEQKLVRAIAKNPTAIFSLGAANVAGLKQLLKQTQQWQSSEASARGLKSQDPASKLPPQHKAWADWARANPNDKRSPAVLKKLGLD